MPGAASADAILPLRAVSKTGIKRAPTLPIRRFGCEIVVLVTRAVTVIETKSELRARWKEAESFDDWQKGTSDLAARLAGQR